MSFPIPACYEYCYVTEECTKQMWMNQLILFIILWRLGWLKELKEWWKK